MKKIFTFVALFVGMGLVVSAQENQTSAKKDGKFRGKHRQERVEKKSPEEIAKIRTERLDKTLTFTDKQREDVYSYNLNQAKKFKERAEVQKKDRETLRNELKADREKFTSLLTPEQQTILAEKSKENRESRMRYNKERQGGKGKVGDRPMRKKMNSGSTDKEESKG